MGCMAACCISSHKSFQQRSDGGMLHAAIYMLFSEVWKQCWEELTPSNCMWGPSVPLLLHHSPDPATMHPACTSTCAGIHCCSLTTAPCVPLWWHRHPWECTAMQQGCAMQWGVQCNGSEQCNGGVCCSGGVQCSGMLPARMSSNAMGVCNAWVPHSPPAWTALCHPKGKLYLWIISSPREREKKHQECIYVYYIYIIIIHLNTYF